MQCRSLGACCLSVWSLIFSLGALWVVALAARAAISTTDDVFPDPATNTLSTDLYVGGNIDGTSQGYNTWRANFGAVSLAIGSGIGSSSNTTVPEPATSSLIFIAIILGLIRPMRRVGCSFGDV